MTAIGLDIGGTKIEAQVFDADWARVARYRTATPDDYAALVTAIADTVMQAQAIAGCEVPVGIATAGRVNPATGLMLTANLTATGHPFPADIAAAVGRPVTMVNDSRALALSEALLGVGRGHRAVAALVLGTGVGGGFALDGALLPLATQTGGEVGHTPAPAGLVADHDLPLLDCGCGRRGCIETLIAGPGLSRLAKALTGAALAPEDLAAHRAGDAEARRVWDIWCRLTAELMLTMTLVADPDIIVLGGGLSQISGVAGDLAKALAAAQLPGYPVPVVALAEGGASSGARGAALAAWQAAQGGTA